MTETFYEVLPYYLLYGMSNEEFWHGNPWLARSYRDAYEMKRKQQNHDMWLQGAYIHEAFAVTLANAFAEKGSTPKRYSSEPYPIFPKTKEELEAEEDRALAQAVDSLNAWERSFNAMYGNKQPDPERT